MSVSTRDVLYPNIVLSLDIPVQSQQTYYLRFQSGASMTLPLTLWTKDAFFIESGQVQMFHWFFFGGILALLVYNLFLLFTLRTYSYLYFIFCDLASVGMLVVLQYIRVIWGYYIFPEPGIP